MVDTHMDSADAFAAGQWEALFAPVDFEGRAIDMANFDLTPTAEEKAAMEAEPAYGTPVKYYMNVGCSSFAPLSLLHFSLNIHNPLPKGRGLAY